MRSITLCSILSGIGFCSAASIVRANAISVAESQTPSKVMPLAKPNASEQSINSNPSRDSTETAQAVLAQTFLSQQPRGSAVQLLTPSIADRQLLAQSAPTSSDSLRQRLIIDPLVELRPPAYTPGSTVGVPSAFGANYGDAFVGLSLSNRRPRINEADGALTVGFGLGDSERAVGLEVSANIGSLRRFASNGDLGFKLHRALPGKASIAVGYDSGIVWGDENRTTVSTIYGVASKIVDLRPGNPVDSLPLTLTIGVGGGRFRSFDNIQNNRGGVGVFGSVGLRVIPQASAIASWTGQDLNLGVSVVPIRTTPLFVTAVVGNVLSLNNNATLFSIGIGYGFNYTGYQY